MDERRIASIVIIIVAIIAIVAIGGIYNYIVNLEIPLSLGLVLLGLILEAAGIVPHISAKIGGIKTARPIGGVLILIGALIYAGIIPTS